MITLVGEQNPYGGDPSYALWPDPKGCAGWRLCHKVLGITADEYLMTYTRVNLCQGPWDAADAAIQARMLLMDETMRFVLCGSKVTKAFGLKNEVFTVRDRFGIIPHPSGRCMLWNEPGAYERARDAIKELRAIP